LAGGHADRHGQRSALRTQQTQHVLAGRHAQARGSLARRLTIELDANLRAWRRDVDLAALGGPLRRSGRRLRRALLDCSRERS
jgi:hypothetical protein